MSEIARQVLDGLERRFGRKKFREMFRSITTDKGSNDNANGLIRRFIPKGANIGKYTYKEIKRIERWLNNDPRRMFGYKSAAEVYAEAVG